MATPFIIPKAYFWDPRTGLPLAFGKVYFYEAGTSDHKPTYSDPGGTVANQQPVTLNGAGYADIYLAGKYKVVVTAADGYVVWTADEVSDITHTYEEWVYPTPAQYVSSMQFRVAGSMTDVFLVGRNMKISDAVTIYAVVSSSYFSEGYTYVTVETAQPLTVNLSYVSISGATTATKLATPRLVNGVPFDGTTNINVPWLLTEEARVSNIEAALNTKAPLTSPALAGTPTAPTAPIGTNTNQLATTAFVTNTVPTGFCTHWPKSTPPPGWLVRDGSTISRTAYAALFAVLGTAYGAGDGVTTFGLPDDRELVVAGYKAGSTEFGVFGGTYGEKKHTLTYDEMPQHSHGYKEVTNNSGSTQLPDSYGPRSTRWVDTSEEGGDLPHNNIQPSRIYLPIIKY